MAKGNHQKRAVTSHPPTDERLCSVDAVAKRWSISKSTVRRKIKDRVLKTVRIGRRVLIPESVVEDVIRNGMHATAGNKASGGEGIGR
jgi:excisionase family DNA binding protein